MRTIRIGRTWAAVAAVVGAIAAGAQEHKPAAVPLVVVSTVPPGLAAGAVLKEIHDPGSGALWLLVDDPAHPGGPGRLVAVGAGKPAEGGVVPMARVSGPEPVIHAGERVQVEEHSAVVDASLQATALGAAVPGGTLRVRLRVGGRVVAALALGPGRARLAPAGARP
ncbi:MAG TPA: hypothetical protein VG267_21545 [Terracidiphilus sp.]|jgi:hypothetical protein|nr:hypothetical protein [Terracidiphilus sp.]